jgi:hypothetical protein
MLWVSPTEPVSIHPSLLYQGDGAASGTLGDDEQIPTRDFSLARGWNQSSQIRMGRTRRVL